MLKTLPIIPSSTSQKFTHYSYVFYSHIITYYSYLFIVLCIDIQRNMNLMHNFVVAIV